MSLKYSYDESLATDKDRVRLYIVDNVEDDGPRPNKNNFSDDEINGVITEEGSWERAVAAFYGILAAEWGQYVDTTVGPRREQMSQAAARYQSLHEVWRKRYGSGSSVITNARTTFPIPVDGYSQDIATDEV